MPLYDFRCPKCDRYFEYRVPLDEFDTEIKCPSCKKGILKRLMSAVLFKI